jgi:CDP-glycerol glycerophosphotransferase (TagB/SpsB family)
LLEKSPNYLCINDSSVEAELFSKATEDLFQFSEIKHNGNTIKELISFEGISLWWFYETNIRKSYKEYLKSRYIAERVLNYLDINDSTQEIITDINSQITLNILRDELVKFNIKLILKEGPSEQSSRYLYILRYIVRYLISTLISKFYPFKGTAPVIIVSYTNYWTKYNVTQDIKKDGIYHEIQEELEKRNIDYLGLEHSDDSLGNFIKTRIEKKRFDKAHWMPLTTYIDLEIIEKSIKYYRQINRNISKLSLSGDENVFILNMLKGKIRDSLLHIIDIKCFQRVLEKVKPKILLVSCEYCTAGRMAVILGDIKGITTLALQHGIITNRSSEFIFSKQERTTTSRDINARPIAKITSVYGKIYRDILVDESTYPSMSIVITGQPRYDVMARANEMYSREAFLEKMGLDAGKRLVFCTTDGLPESRASQNAYALLEVLKEMDDRAQLLIKPHPNNADRNLYERAMEEVGVKGLISSDLNLYEAIYASDVLVTWFSTTALEAILLSKPVVILNLTTEPDYVSYVDEGVAFGAHTKEELILALDKVFRGEKHDAQRRIAFVEKYVHKIDGKATSRVVDTIVDCVNRSKK